MQVFNPGDIVELVPEKAAKYDFNHEASKDLEER